MPPFISKREKVAYVKRAGQTRDHHCHWPGCGKQCPPAAWGCRSCWFKLPKYLRDKLWDVFRPGQEVNRSPSREYVKVAREVQNWIQENAADEDQGHQEPAAVREVDVLHPREGGGPAGS